jgi:putative oxygen-independent coproporphyrinogen III oxidase
VSPLRLPPLSLYIHIPWCVRKCPYCDFNSHENSDFPEQQYVATLLQDIKESSAQAQGRELHSVFFGGGTPSLFSADSIATIMTGVSDYLGLKTEAEVTLEANPGTAEAEKFHGFVEAGINRISLGIQSFDDGCLEALGRIHNSDQAMEAIELAQGVGLDSFNLDLMHGLPDQSMEMALVDVQRAASYRPPHISWYQLTIEPNTAYYKRPPRLPQENVLHSIQDQGERLLQTEGYVPYEVSAWAQAGYRCHHNINYWQFGDYLGIGAGAHSKWTDLAANEVKRCARSRQPENYLQDHGPIQQRTLTTEDLIGEHMMNTLRLHSGFDLAEFSARTGLMAQDIMPALDSLVGRELLEVEDTRYRASELGRRHLDSLLAEFF